MRTAAGFIGAGMAAYFIAWLAFLAVRTHDELGDVKEQLDDLQDHVATDHTNGCAICAARRKRLTGE